MICPACGRAHAQFMEWCSWCGENCGVETLRNVMVKALEKMDAAKEIAYRAGRIIPVTDGNDAANSRNDGDPEYGAKITGYCFAYRYRGPSEWAASGCPRTMTWEDAKAEHTRRWDAYALAEQEWAKARTVFDAAKTWQEQRWAARERSRELRALMGPDKAKALRAREIGRRSVATLSDRYIRQSLKVREAPSSLIEAKRSHLRLKRALKEKS